MRLADRVYIAFTTVCFVGVLVAIAYGMASTADNSPQAVCLTRPWLDIKPPC